jgi:DNA (cytosine-5)-methyltransferase 1
MDENTIFTAVDVFSGCGGLTTGLANAGFNVLAGIEVDEAAAAAYQTNYPDVHLFLDDVRDLTAPGIMETLEIEEGELDLLAGCSPCQGYSRMRTRNRRESVDDERNDLVLDFVRLAEGLSPKTIFFENVPGLCNDERFTQMERRLKAKDFHINHSVVDMAAYGIPQRRRRRILVGSRLGPLVVPQAQGPRCDVQSAIGALPLPAESEDPIHRSLSVHSEAVLERIRGIPRNGGSRLDLGPDAQLNCHRNFDGYRDVYGRMAWSRPAPTITRFSFNPSKGRYLHPEQNREITLREAALLQTFPPDYQFPLEDFGRGAVASMIGEALPPKFAEQLGEYIKLHLQSHL